MNNSEDSRDGKFTKKKVGTSAPTQSSNPISKQHSLSIKQAINLAMQHQMAGDLPAAGKIYQQVLQANPDHPIALHLLGVISAQVGRSDAGIGMIRKALTIQPNYPEAHSNLGNIYRALGHLDAAIDCYKSALSYNADLPEAHCNIGLAFNDLGKLDDAVKHYRKAIAIEPNLAEAHFNLGIVYNSLDKLDEAVASLQKAISIRPNHADAYNNLGSAFRSLGRTEEAIESFREALSIKPDFAEAQNNLGNVYMDLGELEDALASYRKVISVEPGYAEAHRHLSRTKDFSDPDDPDLEAMNAASATPEISDEQKMHLAFGLGKACEDLKQFDKSFDYYATGNAIRNASYNYDEEETKRSFSTLKRVFTKDFFARRQGSGTPDTTPIFVFGMPRSGTTLVEQILASHADVFGAGELHDLDRVIMQRCGQINEPGFTETIEDAGLDIYRDIGEAYLSCLQTYVNGHKRVTDKMPGNFLWAGMIKLMLPNAKVIHCRRSPMDTCLSIFKNYFSTEGLPYAYDLEKLGTYYRCYEDLMAHWREVLPGFVYEIEYENVIADQERETADLLNFCDLQWDDACLAFYNTNRTVKTVSAAQVRKPIYGSSVERWRKYENQLAPLIEALGRK
jgi:tetratricopeptide (TPR) repeat protein